MKALVWHGIGDIRLEEMPEPKLEQATDAIIRLTASAICGTDLHMIRGTMSGMKPGTILGHEAVGIIEALGSDVRNLNIGDRVIVPSTIACGYCVYCRSGNYAQCDVANPNGASAGTAYFGGPQLAGGFPGLQAEMARVPFAHVNLVKLPDDVRDDQAILLSDIFPTGYFAADMADIKPGHTVVVFGCGPVGQFAIASAKIMHAGRIIAVDNIPSRLDMARTQGAETINFDTEDPIEMIMRLTGGIGADRAIDAVGVDANCPHHGPGLKQAQQQAEKFQQEQKQLAPQTNPKDGNWEPGDAPSQVLFWAVESVAKTGTISIVGVYPETAERFPVGKAMNKNLTIRMGICNHRKYIPTLIELVQSEAIDPSKILTEVKPLSDVISAYEAFDKREPGWIKVELLPAGASS